MRSLVAAALLVTATAATADDLKIGHVDIYRVLHESAPAKAAQARIEAEFSKRDKELAELAEQLQSAGEKLDKDSPTLAEAERTRRQEELVAQGRELQRRRRAFQEDLSQRKDEEVGIVVERANRVVKQIFDAEKYDLIEQDAKLWSAKVDITDKVLKALNAPVAVK